MLRIDSFEKLFKESLSDLYPSEELSAIYYILMEDLLGFRKIDLALSKENSLDSEQEDILMDALQRLTQGHPIQHVTQIAHFFGLKFTVSEHTLIPRPETEELVDRIIKDHKATHPTPTILDIGTGSGCIAISLKKNIPSADVTALDISSEAISIAKKNTTDLGCHLEFINADIFEWPFLFDAHRYDVIVSNPPYIRESELDSMDDHVVQFEPHTALFVPDESPLLFYSTIADIGLNHLAPGGVLYLEINQYLGEEVIKLLRIKGYSQLELVKDINGADRFVVARL